MGICCSSFLNANHEGEPAFMNEDNIVAGNKKTNDAENYENDDDQQHRDVVPLLQTEDLKNATDTDTSNGSFDEETISKMMAEIESDS